MLNYVKNEINDGVRKENLILLHELGSEHNGYKQQIDILAKKFDLILIDLNGHGLSKDVKLHNMPDPSFVNVSKQILEVMNYEGIEKSHFMGLNVGYLLQVQQHLKGLKVCS